MRQTELFSKTRRDAPKDEISKNASLLIRAGFIHKEMAGVYSYLPLGLRTLNRVVAIVRTEMENLGGQEVLLSSLQNADLWGKTGRWSEEAVDIWFKAKLKNDSEVGLGFTHEEPLTNLLTEHRNSHKDFPFYIFQIQNKFRNEVRAKSGLIRGREFLMKDMYSFSRDESEHQKFYEKVKKSYLKIFKDIGLPDVFLTFASGGTFSKFSHEFQVVSMAGEDTIFVDKKKKIAVNTEVCSDEILKDLGLSKENLEEKRAIEVGNIFNLGTKFSEPLNLFYLDKNGNKKPVVMGSYGIGLGRLVGTVAEILADERGLVWPESIAPFQAHLLVLGADKKIKAKADKIYLEFLKKKIDVLYDDREVGAGEKFADSDLIGIPWRIVLSERTEIAGKLEVKERKTGKISHISLNQLFKKFNE